MATAKSTASRARRQPKPATKASEVGLTIIPFPVQQELQADEPTIRLYQPELGPTPIVNPGNPHLQTKRDDIFALWVVTKDDSFRVWRIREAGMGGVWKMRSHNTGKIFTLLDSVDLATEQAMLHCDCPECSLNGPYLSNQVGQGEQGNRCGCVHARILQAAMLAFV